MLPGFPKPILSRGGPVPFAMSGSFEGPSNDGFTFTNMFATSSGTPRTGSSCAAVSSAGGTAILIIPAAVAGRLRITMSIWHRSAPGGINRTRSLSYAIGAGGFVSLGSVTNTSITYAQLTGTFDNPGMDDVTMRFEGSSTSAFFDDWAISGVLIP